MVFKVLIVINMVLILASLGAGMLFLAKDDGRGRRVVTSLTLRIALSFSLIALVITGYFSGELQVKGL